MFALVADVKNRPHLRQFCEVCSSTQIWGPLCRGKIYVFNLDKNVSGNALGDFLPQNSSGHPVDRDLSDS
jgi:hypothetical protein